MSDEPTRRTRIGLLAAAGGILVAAATVSGVLGIMSVSRPVTGSAACSLIKPATVAKYLPGTISTPSSSSAAGDAACSWSSPVNDRSRTLWLDTYIADNSVAITGWSEIALARDSETGAKVSSADELVPGLGDRARATLITVSHAGSGNSPVYDVVLEVSSGNATISLIMGPAPATYGSVSPASAARQAGLVAMARDVLAALPRKS
ncbi:MAG TPA: hypothetical protein VF070_40670 [Streptosporangiaceae bacterium]